MKNALLALTLFAFIGSAAAHEGKDTPKKDKKDAKTCTMGEKAGASCCMKKGGKTAALKPAALPSAPATKSL